MGRVTFPNNNPDESQVKFHFTSDYCISILTI